jgi:hypothetical protein
MLTADREDADRCKVISTLIGKEEAGHKVILTNDREKSCMV